MPQAFVVSQRQLTRELLSDLLRSRCGIRVAGRFASLEECARRLAMVQLVVCDAEGASDRALESFIARARARSPAISVLRVENTDSVEDIVGKAHALTLPAIDSIQNLTRHEIDVLLAVSSGLRNSDIARRMRRSPKTVEKHRANLQRKLGLRNLAQLTAYTIQHGLMTAAAILRTAAAEPPSRRTRRGDDV